VTVDGNAVDPVHPQRTGGKRGHRDRRGHDGIDALENIQESRAQAAATIARLDIVDPAVSRAFRHNIAIVAVGGCQRTGIAGGHGCGLLGVGDRLQDPLQHIRREPGAIRHDAGAERTERLDRLLKCLAHIGRNRRVAKVGTGADPDAIERSRRRIEMPRRHRQACGIAQIMRCDDFEQQRRVGNGPRDRPGVRQRGP